MKLIEMIQEALWYIAFSIISLSAVVVLLALCWFVYMCFVETKAGI